MCLFEIIHANEYLTNLISNNSISGVMNDNRILCLGGKGSAPSDQVDEDSGDQEETQQNDRGKPDAQYTNGYGRGSRGGRGRGFRGYRPRYIRRGGFRAQKPGGNPEVIKFF